MQASKVLLCAAALACAGSSATAQLSVGLVGIGFPEVAQTLRDAGFTVVENPNLNQQITVDTLYFGRGNAGLNQNVRDWLNAGGTVITEFTGTDAWFNGQLANFSGNARNNFYTPSGDVCGGNTITVTDPNDPLADGLPNSWVSGDPIGVFNVYQNVDPNITVPIKLVGDGQFGDIPVVGRAQVGLGCGIMFFTDFGDFNPDCGRGIQPEERRLLINAVQCVIPAPGAAGVLALGGIAAIRRRR